MPTPIHTPRINNNDDQVRLAKVLVAIGAAVKPGDPILDVETDKATFTVESGQDGFLLAVNGKEGDMVEVGSILAWIGMSPDEIVEPITKNGLSPQTREPTLKALLLLKQYGLSADEIPASGVRLTVDDVELYRTSRAEPPSVPGRIVPFTPVERGMARTVEWHRDEAVPGYVELQYDPSSWDSYAKRFQERHQLLLSPLLALMAWRLARLAAEQPRINATASAEGAFVFDQVNLGFTVQADTSLYVVVVREAGRMEEADFVNELGKLQRAAMKHSLTIEQTSGATIGFTSMARWNVTRHIPVMLPETSLMVAHSVATLGATYDHRLLTGFDVVQVLRALSSPPNLEN